MATCKDCLHVGVCGKLIWNEKDGSVICEDFKSKEVFVEVVRCRDCKHCSKNTPDGFHWCNEHERGLLGDDDFCSYGERKDNERE